MANNVVVKYTIDNPKWAEYFNTPLGKPWPKGFWGRYMSQTPPQLAGTIEAMIGPNKLRPWLASFDCDTSWADGLCLEATIRSLPDTVNGLEVEFVTVIDEEQT